MRRVIKHSTKHKQEAFRVGVLSGCSAVVFASFAFLTEGGPFPANAFYSLTAFLFILAAFSFHALRGMSSQYVLEEKQFIIIDRKGNMHFIILEDVLTLNWPTRFFKSRIQLKTKEKTYSLSLFDYSLNARRHLVLYFRRHIPIVRQTNWSSFGLKTGVWLLTKKDLWKKEPPTISKPVAETKPLYEEINWKSVLFCFSLFPVIIGATQLELIPHLMPVPLLYCSIFFMMLVLRLAKLFRTKNATSKSEQSSKPPYLLLGLNCFQLYYLTFYYFVTNANESPWMWGYIRYFSLILIAFFIGLFLCFLFACFKQFRTEEHRIKVAERKAIIPNEWNKIEQRFRIADADLQVGQS